ncbi:MAG: alpha/beta fold hydrolase [Planctomycetota bacterium]|nr:alpha/beta fold hydrolase [Planctomycetota bacterium]
MHPRFAAFPRALAAQARTARLGPSRIPALLVHPDWQTPAPTLIWLHGRTVSKELDPGRYLRLLRAGIASVAIDLPGHGEREGPSLHAPKHTIEVVTQAVGEIDQVVAALTAPTAPTDPTDPTDPARAEPTDAFEPGVFDTTRLALGGMSAGGMVTLRRLCDPHPFSAALVEGTSGRLADLYFPPEGTARTPWPIDHPRAAVDAIDPSQHLETWRPIPLLAISATTDRVVAFETQQRFLDDLRAHYAGQGADPGLVELQTYADTGAPEEHAGFGKFGNNAKNTATGFLVRCLNP